MADGKPKVEDKTKADKRNTLFISVFTPEDKIIPDIEPKYQCKDCFNICFRIHIIEKNIKKLKVTKFAGPDGLHPRVLSDISPSINLPLNYTCTTSYDDGRPPRDRKNTNITPIHKNDLKLFQDIPVTLTSVIGKMMESVIRDSPVNHMIDHKLFFDQQPGFIPGRSCIT